MITIAILCGLHTPSEATLILLTFLCFLEVSIELRLLASTIDEHHSAEGTMVFCAMLGVAFVAYVLIA